MILISLRKINLTSDPACEIITRHKKFFPRYRKNTFSKLKGPSRTQREKFFAIEKKYVLDFETSIENPLYTEENFFRARGKIRFRD